ncbi:MAG TPA: DoxX family protein [Candidatus Binatia bacterium]|nr:DoxX family protein [Candidatus Binatia bacterium]
MALLAKSVPGRGAIFIRVAVGLIFFTQGILKYTDARMGMERFTRIGFPHPAFTAHLVGAFEIVCGLLVLLGLYVRIAALPLLVIISTAIVTTKIPELTRAGQGFWYMVSDARTDFAMLMCLLFLLLSPPNGKVNR